jgi:hypothetical protein
VWRHVGPEVQSTLASVAAGFDERQRKSLFRVVLIVCRHALSTDVEGTTFGLDTVTLSQVAVVVSGELVTTRRKALGILKTLYDEGDDEQRRAIFDVMMAATRTPDTSNYGDDLVKVVLEDGAALVGYLTRYAVSDSFELIQHIEHRLLWLYRRGTKEAAGQTSLGEEQRALSSAILGYRDAANARPDFVVYRPWLASSLCSRHNGLTRTRMWRGTRLTVSLLSKNWLPR